MSTQVVQRTHYPTKGVVNGPLNWSHCISSIFYLCSLPDSDCSLMSENNFNDVHIGIYHNINYITKKKKHHSFSCHTAILYSRIGTYLSIFNLILYLSVYSVICKQC